MFGWSTTAKSTVFVTSFAANGSLIYPKVIDGVPLKLVSGLGDGTVGEKYSMKRLLQLPDSCSGFGFLPLASSVLPPASVLGSLLEKYSGIEFLQIPGRTPASGSPMESTPGQVPGTTPFL